MQAMDTFLTIPGTRSLWSRRRTWSTRRSGGTMSEDTIAYEAEAPATAAQGYRPPPRYRTITAMAGTAFDGAGSGSQPLTATIRSNLTGGELEWLKAAKAKG